MVVCAGPPKDLGGGMVPMVVAGSKTDGAKDGVGSIIPEGAPKEGVLTPNSATDDTSNAGVGATVPKGVEKEVPKAVGIVGRGG